MARSSPRRSRLRPDGRIVRRTGIGLLAGAVGGWLAGLMRAPKERS